MSNVRENGTPFGDHGKLSVKGIDIVDKNGEVYQLKGVSTSGIAWYPEYINKGAFTSFRDDFNANIIRLAMYTAEYDGFCTDGNKEDIKGYVKKGVELASELGMYVIVDWHILSDNDPHIYEDEAAAYFEEMSALFKDHDNVLYEICNEPNGDTKWSDVKSYAKKIIPIIRNNDKDAVIIVGTPNWSQDVDEAAKDPLEGDNIAYAVHFYAATHKDNIRDKAKIAREKGLCVFISEFSICDASGNGALDYASAKEWIDYLNENRMSYIAWNISNKDESSAFFKPDCVNYEGSWEESEMNDSAIWLKKTLRGE